MTVPAFLLGALVGALVGAALAAVGLILWASRDHLTY